MRRPAITLSLILPLAAAVLAACVPTGPDYPAAQPSLPPAPVTPPLSPAAAQANFTSVLARMESVIEGECRARTRGVNCDYRISVLSRPGEAPNAYQSLDGAGRPIIAFNSALIAEARNSDELAFVMGHEAAHHIAGHIPRQQQTALAGGLAGGLLAAAIGANSSTIDLAQDIGASVGARVYSKDHELEADGLGTVLTCGAGYDPIRGSAFFARIPDPGDRFLGSHPPNGRRVATVQSVAAQIGCR